jgi:UDP-glucose 4-epimerase
MIAAAGARYGITGVALRYFNACGADPEGRIGEAHHPETHLIPLALEAAIGGGQSRDRSSATTSTRRTVAACATTPRGRFGRAHVAALEAELERHVHAFNVGVGRASRVRGAAGGGAATGAPVPPSVGPRREGDRRVGGGSPRGCNDAGWRPRTPISWMLFALQQMAQGAAYGPWA